MITLFLDTSNQNLIININKDDEICYSLMEETNNKLSDTLLPKINDALIKLNLNINDIDRIYVVDGPGSFTGIRIGLTFAKTFGWAKKKEIIKISELEVLASGKYSKNNVAPIIDARRGYVYGALYSNGKNIIKDQYIELSELINLIKEKALFDDTIFVSFDEFENIETIKPQIDINNIINKHKNDSLINPHNLNPNYLKLTEAEERLNDKENK